MKKKFNELLGRNSDQELKAYFAKMPAGRPLDIEEEMALLETCSDEAIKAYITRFRFSEKAEIFFLQRAPADIRLTYINIRGLSMASQKHIIKENMVTVASDFLRIRRFEDIPYLLEHGTPAMISAFIRRYPLENDKQVKTLLFHENKYLFKTYVTNHDNFICDDIIELIIDKNLYSAFNTIVYQYWRNFKKKSRNMTYQQMVEAKLANVILSEPLQLKVLDTVSMLFINPMLDTTPLYPSIQKELFLRNYDLDLIKRHASHLYGRAGYRFTPELEKELFTMLSSKDLDEFLSNLRFEDDVTFVTCASFKAIEKYIKDRWLSDDAQVALINRGNGTMVRQLISRYTPEHGLCWQAEVALVKLGDWDNIKAYISFHTMCSEAIGLLHRISYELVQFYYAHHSY